MMRSLVGKLGRWCVCVGGGGALVCALVCSSNDRTATGQHLVNACLFIV